MGSSHARSAGLRLPSVNHPGKPASSLVRRPPTPNDQVHFHLTPFILGCVQELDELRLYCSILYRTVR